MKNKEIRQLNASCGPGIASDKEKYGFFGLKGQLNGMVGKICTMSILLIIIININSLILIVLL